MTCFVYVIAHLKDGDVLGLPVKVGVTSNLEARVATIQCGNPEDVRLVAAFQFSTRDAAHKIERKVHTELVEKNLTGREWFWVDPPVAVDAINQAILEAV